jgi:hypothetical protein
MAMHPLLQSGAPPENLHYYYNHFRKQSPIISRFFPQKKFIGLSPPGGKLEAVNLLFNGCVHSHRDQNY